MKKKFVWLILLCLFISSLYSLYPTIDKYLTRRDIRVVCDLVNTVDSKKYKGRLDVVAYLTQAIDEKTWSYGFRKTYESMGMVDAADQVTMINDLARHVGIEKLESCEKFKLLLSGRLFPDE